MAQVESCDWHPRGVDSLEPTAESVVRSSQNALVVAGPGAGKTELLAQRACFLLETGGCRHPNRILAISFKRDAAKNLRDRVERRCGELAQRFDSLTLDAFGKSLVDRFRSALPVEWRPPSGYEVMVRPPTVTEIRRWFSSILIPNDLQQVDFGGMEDDRIKANFEKCVFGVALPYDGAVRPLLRFFGLRWWQLQLSQRSGEPSLMFPMLNRLAAFLLRTNPTLLLALRATYSHVFLDEYQDTTAAQYDVVQAAFQGSAAVVTAVGDGKQQIMVWAGAMPNAFEVFTNDFAAQTHHLIRNYRSAPELVRIQDTIAQAIESATPQIEAAQRRVTTGVCYIAEFSNPEQEAAYLANLIAGELATTGASPRDYCILVRQQAASMIATLQGELRTRGVRLRDESNLQDLLAEPVVVLVLSVLRLASRPRDPEAWEQLNQEFARINGVDLFDDSQLISAEIATLIQSTKALAQSGTAIEDLGEKIAANVGHARLRSTYPQYSNEKYLSGQLQLLGTALKATNSALKDAVDELIGREIIPAMTVHKSKGLEFQTVIFLGLEDSQLWNFARQSEEERRGFFVAFSRAITRVIFTFSDWRDGRRGRSRQDRKVISDLYGLLHAAGVQSRDLRQ